MPRNNVKQHIKFEGYNQSLSYIYPRASGGRPQNIKSRNRSTHGNRIKQELEQLKQEFQIPSNVELNEDIIRDDAIYVEFITEWGYAVNFDSLDSNKQPPVYQLLNVREEIRTIGDISQQRYHVTVMMTEGGISDFIRKVERFINEDTQKGRPKNERLISNLEIIQKATLKAFWTDLPSKFPNEDEGVWWEVWFRKTNDFDEKFEAVVNNIEAIGGQIGRRQIVLTEHIVKLVKGTVEQLSSSLLLLDNLAELRQPQILTDFIWSEGNREHREYRDDLIDRIENSGDENSTTICLIDSGIQNQHPLLLQYLRDEDMYTVNSDWGKYDSVLHGGHGTGMAGLALYGDLADLMANNLPIRIFHKLESVKVYHQDEANDPKLYGAITEEACSTPIVDKPRNNRVFCMSVTSEENALKGRPSSWSASVDKIAFGTALSPKLEQLFIVSGGNVRIENRDEYPYKNLEESTIHDPSQAYNAITVGTYTQKMLLSQNISRNYTPLAGNGDISPSNSTSKNWDNQWPIKPDIVMEGGNLAYDENGNVVDVEELRLITTDKRYQNYIFNTFGDTSGAAALASKMAAELRTAFPTYWPETIRALMIHSAEWTSAMLGGGQITDLQSEAARKSLLRTVGYGVPILEKALHSSTNALTLIAERSIKPYRLDGSNVKYDQYHFYELPWPKDVLQSTNLVDKDVTLTLTLSYYIEPNPGAKRYSSSYYYHSHDLDFAVIKPEEDKDTFKKRISKAARDEGERVPTESEPWTLKRVRSKGSIQKDFITMSGAEMATRNMIAIFPKNGWYRSRKKLGKYNSIVRYSLIISLETPEQNVDLYTPVLHQIQIDNPIEV